MSNRDLNLVTVAYDQRYFGTSFAFIEFLCAAEGHRKIISPETDGIALLVVTGDNRREAAIDFKGVRFGEIYQNLDDYNRQGIDKMLLPMASLIPSVRSIALIDAGHKPVPESLGGKLFYPSGIDLNSTNVHEMDLLYPFPRYLYATAATTDVRFIRNSSASLRSARAYAARLAQCDAPVVFTLRNHKFSSDRSRDNYDRYISIAEKLSKNYPVIVIPDTSDISTTLDTSLPVAYEASLCIRMRSALYEIAFANFCGGAGPASLMNLNKNVTYYEADIYKEGLHHRRWLEKQWLEARVLIEKSNFPGRRMYLKRLRQLKEGRNFYTPNSTHQVCDYERLTLEEAERFLKELAPQETVSERA